MTSTDTPEPLEPFELTMSVAKPMKVRRSKVPQEDLTIGALKAFVPKESKTPKVKKDTSLRALFRAKLSALDIEKLKKPWMASMSFVSITTEEGLIRYVDEILADQSRWHKPYADGPLQPVIAVDTETHGLDTRVMVDFELKMNHETGVEECIPIYELNIEIAGVCLSADGKCGVYISIHHDDGLNVSLEIVNQQLQRLFDVSHLVFYNAKFDREVLRLTCGINFRPYPHFEDVQVLHYSNDPKADLGDDTFTTGGDGLKGLSHDELGFQQISLSEIGKVKAKVEPTPEELEIERIRPNWTKVTKKTGPMQCKHCEQPAKYIRSEITFVDGLEIINVRGECAEHSTKVKYKAHGLKMQLVPFTWIPTPIALWYAAADAICTWLLWEKKHVEARDQRRMVHQIDGTLVDSVTWIERQRFLVDTEAHARLVRWANRSMEARRDQLRRIANEDGWEERTTDEGVVIADTIFKVESRLDLPKLLFDIKCFRPTKLTDTGLRSTDKEAIKDLIKLHPHDKFLTALKEYKEYASLHPEKLSWDPRDKSARIYLKQARVAGGRFAAAGGEFARDGGLSLNIQAVKKVGGNWWVKGDVLVPDVIKAEDIEEYEESQLHPSCFIEAKKDEIVDSKGSVPAKDSVEFVIAAAAMGFAHRNGKWTRKAPGIINNHIANYIGYAICLVPGCKSCSEKHGVLIAKGRMDANQIINLRALFVADVGWTFFATDFSNIEMRVAANISLEPKFIKEFLEGSGDFHTLTAINVFPEFSDPNTSKSRRKELRNLAKIINFALLYGGTGHTVYQNMRKIDPNITLVDAMKMVDAYWVGVPVYRAWCDAMQKVAREQLTCTTATNRRIRFDTAMAGLGIRVPTNIEKDNLKTYYRLRKKYREFEAQHKELVMQGSCLNDVQMDEMMGFKKLMDDLYFSKESGVKNAADHMKFMGKIERVSVNVPLQGLAGEFMRMCINRICYWAVTIDPLVQSVLRVHGSVHDEMNYAVKNQYVPFVVPRMTRMMKLRKLHKLRNWPVPIEADTEFGHSWDAAFHLTGDDGHLPSGYTDIAGLEQYLPDMFSYATVEHLMKALFSEKEGAREKADAWMKANLHPRAYDVAWHCFYTEDRDKVRHRHKDRELVLKQVYATLQLHEYWMIDGVDDGEEMESFIQYEERRGLTAADRGYMPPGGWLQAIPMNQVKRKPIPALGPAPVPVETDQATPAPFALPKSLWDEEDYAVTIMAPQLLEDSISENASQLAIEETASGGMNEAEEDGAAPEVDMADEFFLPPPKKRTQPLPPPPAVEEMDKTPQRFRTMSRDGKVSMPPLTRVEESRVIPENIPVLRPLLESEVDELLVLLGKTFGDLEVQVLFEGVVMTIKRVTTTEIPEKFLAA